MLNRKLFVILALVAVFVAGQAIAQVVTYTGSVYGKVVDANGAPLPGVTVTVEGSGMAPKTLTSGDGGSYRFAGLSPGTYSVSFTLEGFTELRQEDVALGAGQNINLDVTLKQSTEEVVVVTGTEPLVDTKKTQVASNYNQEYLKNVPSARDPWVILDQTPGIDVDRVNVGGNQSGQQSNYSARGADFSKNGWNYDGVDITDPGASGATPMYYDFDSFEEIQVTTGGQDPAVGTAGVVINFVTKRGGNSWSGSGSVYFDNDSLQGDNLDADLLKQHLAAPSLIDQVYEWGGDLGGPIVKDKAWIWGAYRKQDIKSFKEKYILHDQANTALNGTLSGGAPQHIQLTDVNLKFNVAYNPANEGTFSYAYSKKDFLGRFAYPPNQQSLTSLFNQSGPTGLYKAEHSWIPNANLFLNAKFAYVDGKFNLDPIAGVGLDAQPVLRLAHGDFYFENGLYFYHTKRPQWNLSEDTNFFKQNWAGGDHEFKFGFAYKNANVTTTCQYGGDLIAYDFSGNRGDQSLGAFGEAKLRYLVNGPEEINSLGVYGGDTWRMNRLTLNLGLHYDHTTTKALAADAPANIIAPDLLPALHFPGQDGPTFDNVSPRLGATYDISGTGKSIIRGNYARFYDGVGPFPSEFVSPLGERADYTGLYVYYSDANGDGTITRNELLDNIYGLYGTIGGFVPGNPAATLANNLATRTIADNLNGEKTDEFLAGFEQQIGNNMSVGATYIYRKYDDLQDTYRPGITSSDFTCVPYTVVNPVTGESFTTQTRCDIPAVVDALTLLNVNNRSRTYNGVELTWTKKMSDNWMLRANGEIKDQKIQYDDNGTNFGDSFQDPTNIAFTDNTWWAPDSAGSGSGGVFYGARWSFKLSGAYQFPHDFTVGGYFKAIDGNIIPIIRRLGFQNYTNGAQNVLLAPNDSVRLDTLKYMDLRIEKGFAFSSYGKLSVTADIFNAFNTNTALRIDRRANVFSFKETQEVVSPRIVRFGFKYNF